MHEILALLSDGDRVLDLGARQGSFPPELCRATAIRADIEDPGPPRPRNLVVCDASALPFPDASFSAVIANHCLEHLENPVAALAEASRVLGEAGHLYIAVPDASTLTDRLYRWLGRGGGHVQRFLSLDQLTDLAERSTGMPLVGARVLFTSLSFLNRRNIPGPGPRKLILLGGGRESVLRLVTLLLRVLDRTLGTRLGVYGWAAYFGSPIAVERNGWTNVCVRCGAGHSADRLVVERRALRPALFHCPSCGAMNYFTRDVAPTRRPWLRGSARPGSR